MKKRWLSLYVENDTGILAKISGLFAGKVYNLETITAGTTQDTSMTRITIGLRGDDATFDQIKRQLNSCVGIIKVIDFTEADTIMKELMFIKIRNYSQAEKDEIFQIAAVCHADIVSFTPETILLESVNSDKKNDELISLMTKYPNIEIVRGGIVAIERN